MIRYGIYLVLVVNVCVITAQPATTPIPTLNCSACEDVVDLIVCGTDGKTYINECRFKCAKLNDTSLDVKHSSVCEKDREGCSCTDDSNSTVCGTDGKTYDTKCIMWCENWVNGYGSIVQVSHDGPCKNQTNVKDGNKTDHYKYYEFASGKYHDAGRRYDEAALLFNNAACLHIEKAGHYHDAKMRHNYPKTNSEVNQYMHEAIQFMEEATRNIIEATNKINEATKRVAKATIFIDKHA